MPHFRNIPFREVDGGDNFCDILFIHIPKTGGTSVEDYFYNKYKYSCLRGFFTLYGQKHERDVPFHHMTYNQIKEKVEDGSDKYFKKINLSNLKILTIVRNPYDRILSELFSKGFLKLPTTPEIVEKVVHEYLTGPTDYDNHRLPQSHFLKDIPAETPPIILQTHTLTEQMRDLGFADFSNKSNVSRGSPKSYNGLLSDAAKREIYEYYRDDFIMLDTAAPTAPTAPERS